MRAERGGETTYGSEWQSTPRTPLIPSDVLIQTAESQGRTHTRLLFLSISLEAGQQRKRLPAALPTQGSFLHINTFTVHFHLLHTLRTHTRGGARGCEWWPYAELCSSLTPLWLEQSIEDSLNVDSKVNIWSWCSADSAEKCCKQVLQHLSISLLCHTVCVCMHCISTLRFFLYGPQWHHVHCLT